MNPIPMILNARKALDDYSEIIFGEKPVDVDEYANVMTALLSDLRHFCEAETIDFKQQVAASYDLYAAEKGNR
ncbi:MAG: hypothetical protein ACK443_05820 [Methylococcaceae bacterium]|jgi:hypothetical protein